MAYRPLPLVVAAQRGDVEAAEALVAAGEDLSALDWTGVSAPHIAAATGDLDFLRFCLSNGVSPDLQDTSGASLTCSAASNGRVDVLAVLLEAGCDIDLPSRPVGATPLFMAGVNGFEDMVGALLRAGASEERAVEVATARGGFEESYFHETLEGYKWARATALAGRWAWLMLVRRTAASPRPRARSVLPRHLPTHLARAVAQFILP